MRPSTLLSDLLASPRSCRVPSLTTLTSTSLRVSFWELVFGAKSIRSSLLALNHRAKHQISSRLLRPPKGQGQSTFRAQWQSKQLCAQTPSPSSRPKHKCLHTCNSTPLRLNLSFPSSASPHETPPSFSSARSEALSRDSLNLRTPPPLLSSTCSWP